ncbi:hypothetical protein U1Q18_015870 [Sarracenia purpurea var. burkii]
MEMYRGRIRWPEFDFSIATSSLRWPEINFSDIAVGWPSLSFRSWFDYSIDNVLWTFITVVETLALAAMLCCFFTFCGCTL